MHRKRQLKNPGPLKLRSIPVIITAIVIGQFAPGLMDAHAQKPGYHENIPRVVVPTSSRASTPSAVSRTPTQGVYPWRTHITATIFWVGEQPTQNNPTPNCKSSWDTRWAENFGGYDSPDPDKRIACHVRGEFRPKGFTPQLNPFYIALPYNDVMRGGRHKPEASRVVPWFNRFNPSPGRTVLKGRWVQIHYNGRSCFAQWEDCGPWVTDDWEYVFGDKRPKTNRNNSAGIDLSPAVRDYLGMRSHQKVHWRFVEDHLVPHGPWMRYGPQPSPGSAAARRLEAAASAVTTARPQAPSGPMRRPGPDADIETQRRYLEYLRKMRDESFEKKPLRDLQR